MFEHSSSLSVLWDDLQFGASEYANDSPFFSSQVSMRRFKIATRNSRSLLCWCDLDVDAKLIANAQQVLAQIVKRE